MELKLEDLYQELGITEFLGPSGDWGRASRAIPALPAVTPKPPEAPKRSKGEILNDYDMQQCEQEDEGEVALKKPTSARRKRAPRPNATTVTILELENRLKALLEEHTRAGQENQRLRNRLGVSFVGLGHITSISACSNYSCLEAQQRHQDGVSHSSRCGALPPLCRSSRRCCRSECSLATT